MTEEQKDAIGKAIAAARDALNGPDDVFLSQCGFSPADIETWLSGSAEERTALWTLDRQLALAQFFRREARLADELTRKLDAGADAIIERLARSNAGLPDDQSLIQRPRSFPIDGDPRLN